MIKSQRACIIYTAFQTRAELNSRVSFTEPTIVGHVQGVFVGRIFGARENGYVQMVSEDGGVSVFKRVSECGARKRTQDNSWRKEMDSLLVKSVASVVRARVSAGVGCVAVVKVTQKKQRPGRARSKRGWATLF